MNALTEATKQIILDRYKHVRQEVQKLPKADVIVLLEESRKEKSNTHRFSDYAAAEITHTACVVTLEEK